MQIFYNIDANITSSQFCVGSSPCPANTQSQSPKDRILVKAAKKGTMVLIVLILFHCKVIKFWPPPFIGFKKMFFSLNLNLALQRQQNQQQQSLHCWRPWKLRTDLIFVTNITNIISGEKIAMWRKFSFPCMTVVGKLKISPHVEKF